MHGSTNIML